LEEGLEAGVNQLISHLLSALAVTLGNETRVKAETYLDLLLAKRSTMQRELMTTKARLSTTENQEASSLPGTMFQGDWLMVVNFFAQ
jgi:hypothetical protein